MIDEIRDTKTLFLWDTSISYKDSFAKLNAFSLFLSHRAKKFAGDFLAIGTQKKLGWLVSSTDFFEAELQRVCDDVSEYITQNSLLNIPNWKMFLAPWIEIARASGQLILLLNRQLIANYTLENQKLAEQVYNNSLNSCGDLGFSVISNSITAHLIYAVQAAVKDVEIEREAREKANSILSNGNAMAKANDITIQIYHKTHEPFVLDTITQFFASIESFIYTGVGYDKGHSVKTAETSANILSAQNEDFHSKIIQALKENICCGEAILATIRNNYVDSNFVSFCHEAPVVLIEKSVPLIIEWLRKEKYTSKLYNRPIFNNKMRQYLFDIQRIFSRNCTKVSSLYDQIIDETFSEEIESTRTTFSDLLFDERIVENYAQKGNFIEISDESIDLIDILLNVIHCSKIISFTATSKLELQINRDNIVEFVKRTNEKISSRRQDLEKELVAERERVASIMADRKRREEKERMEAEAKRKKQNKIIKVILIALTAILVAVLTMLLWVWPSILRPSIRYDEAEAMLVDGRYEEAIVVFSELGEYRDAPNRIVEVQASLIDAQYSVAENHLERGEYIEAIHAFSELRGYRDSDDMVNEARYQYACSLLNQGQYIDAISVFHSLAKIEYKDSLSKIDQGYCMLALDLENEGDIQGAIRYLKCIDNDPQITEKLLELQYTLAADLFTQNEYAQAKEIYLEISPYKDSDEMIEQCDYNMACKLLDAEQYAEAISIFETLSDYNDSQERLATALSRYYLSVGIACMNEAKYYAAAEALSNSSEPSAIELLNQVESEIAYIDSICGYYRKVDEKALGIQVTAGPANRDHCIVSFDFDTGKITFEDSAYVSSHVYTYIPQRDARYAIYDSYYEFKDGVLIRYTNPSNYIRFKEE